MARGSSIRHGAFCTKGRKLAKRPTVAVVVRNNNLTGTRVWVQAQPGAGKSFVTTNLDRVRLVLLRLAGMKSTWKKLAVFSLVALLGVAFIAEIVARLAGAGATPVVPEQRYWSIEAHTNLYGQMDDSAGFLTGAGRIPRHKSAGKKRVLCLGSSSTRGAGVGNRDLVFPSILDRQLPNVEVYNAGIGGYNSFQLFILLSEVLVNGSPDIVIFYYGGNEGYGESAKQFYARTTKIVAAMRARGVTDRRRLHNAVCHGTDNFFALLGYRLLDESAVFRWLRAATLRARYVADLSPFQKATAAFEPTSKAIIEQMAALGAKRGFKLLLVPEIGMMGGHINPQYFQLMQDTCATGKAYCLDPLAPLHAPPTPGMFLDTTHFNPEGHRWLANILLTEIHRLLAAPEV